MVRRTGATRIRRLSISIEENINMGKDNHKSPLDKDGVSPADEEPTLVVPSVRTKGDRLNQGSIAYALAADDSDDALDSFYINKSKIDETIRENESRFLETGKIIDEDKAKMLAKWIKNLNLNSSFDKRADHIVCIAGQCLELKEGKPVGDVYTACVWMVVIDPSPTCPELRGLELCLELVVSVELTHAFGPRRMKWLNGRSHDFAREHVGKILSLGSRSRLLFDGECRSFLLDPDSRNPEPKPSSIPVVPAPNENTIAECIKKAVKHADDWDALVKIAAILRKNQQPFGDALSEWLVRAAEGKAKRPKGSTAGRKINNKPRNSTICEVIQALERCGMKAATSDREPGPACYVCADVFADLFRTKPKPGTILQLWKTREKN